MIAGTMALPANPGGIKTLTLGSTLFVGPVRPVGAGVEEEAVFVLQSGGARPMPYMGQADSWHTTHVQVMVRGLAEQFQRAEGIARGLIAVCHLHTPVGYTYLLALDSDPIYVGETDNGSHLFSLNLEAGHRR